MYLDAPVVNLLSCPFGVGREKPDNDMAIEFVNATGKTLSDIINYRNHPYDKLNKLVQYNIPVFLVSGDSDSIVPYNENGFYIDKIYRENGCIIETVIKEGGDHHPHSLPDNTPILSFIAEYDK